MYMIGGGGTLFTGSASAIQLPGGVCMIFPLSVRVMDVLPNFDRPILSGNPSTQIFMPGCSVFLSQPFRVRKLGGLISTVQRTIPFAWPSTLMKT